jgi:hypothetical protein
MNIIEAQRETVIKENNIAQKQLLDILENVNKRSNNIDIREPLHGDLDFSVLRELGFTNIKFIFLSEGEITNISNLPETVLSLKCEKNLLFSLENLPSSLIHLEIPHNYLSELDFTNLKQLKYLNVSHNYFTGFENLPLEINEIYCENNSIRHLDLKGLVQLNTLNISNNKITIIENLPENIVVFKMENNPSIEFRNSPVIPPIKDGETTEEENVRQNLSFVETLQDYFALKTQYETKLKQLKKTAFTSVSNKKLGMKKARNVKAPCVQCKRKVGTIFSLQDDRYTCICGDTEKPCNLRIEIYRGNFSSIQSLMYDFKDHIDELKDNIIKRKLDTLFSYISEEESVKVFKKELESYNYDSGMYKELVENYDNNHNNSHRNELIQKKKDLIFKLTERIRGLLAEYEKTSNREFLKSAVELQIKDLLPETQNLRLLSSEIIEMNTVRDSSNSNNMTDIHVLFKRDVVLSKSDFTFGEKPRVISAKMPNK